MRTIDPTRCQRIIYGDRCTSWQCKNKPRPGDKYCGLHDSVAKARTQVRRDKAYAEYRAKWDGIAARQAETQRKLASYDGLVVENARLRAALKEAGDDYPGSSFQKWCYAQIAETQKPAEAGEVENEQGS